MVDIRVGQTTVPNPLKGLEQAAAEEALFEADLVVAYATSQYSTQYAVGEIMDVDVTEGADIDPGSTVTLTVSLGVEPVAGMGGGFDFGFGFGFFYGAAGGGGSSSPETIWDDIWQDIWDDIWADAA